MNWTMRRNDTSERSGFTIQNTNDVDLTFRIFECLSVSEGEVAKVQVYNNYKVVRLKLSKFEKKGNNVCI